MELADGVRTVQYINYYMIRGRASCYAYGAC